jgi:glutaredoxin
VIKLYSTSWCGPCKNAKRLLDERGISYDEIDIDEIGWSRDDLYDLTGGRTVPQIVIDEKPIGGYGDLLKLDREGKLVV